MKLIELRDDEPLIIQLLRGCMARNEPVYLGLGSLRYYLRRIEFVPPAQWSDGDYWKLSFSQNQNSLVTDRRVNQRNADDWRLEKEVNRGGDIRWKMYEDSHIWKDDK
jgi:hypothetical protein